jgi:Bcr/CflA subfamily drug resistance transporter
MENNKKMRSISMPGYTRIIILLCLISSLGRFVLDSYFPSMPAIGEHFGISDAGTQYTLTLYLLGFSVSQLIYGPLSDYYGRRNVIITGMLIFIVGNSLCMFAGSSKILMLGRLIAGVGAGACGVLNRAIASDCFEGAEFSKAWSYTTTTLVLTLCIAPLIGGITEQGYGWRANFILSTFYVGFVLFLILKFLPETSKISLREQSAVNAKNILKNYYEVLTTPSFIAGTMCYTLSFAGVIAYFQVSPIIFMGFNNLTPTQYGISSIFIAGNYLLGGYIVNKYVASVGTQALLTIGTVLLMLGGLTMLTAYAWHYTNVFAVILTASIYILGARIIIPNAIANSMRELRHLGGTSSALIGCIQMLGSSLLSVIIASIAKPPQLVLAVSFIVLGGTTLTILLSMREPRLDEKAISC